MERIAIVGAGVSGLVAAHVLRRQHDVTVFEANSYAGGHTNTVRVDTADETHHVDTGFIVFNDRNYPNFERLLQQLGIAAQPSDMSFSVSDGADFEYSSTSLNGLYANRRNVLGPSFQRMVAEVPRFQRAARRLLSGTSDDQISLRDWLVRERFSRLFVDGLIVPQAAAVWSADPAQLWNFPARFLARFFDNHGMLGLTGRPEWRTVRGGSARYVDAIVAPLRAEGRLRLGTTVRGLRRDADGVVLVAMGPPGGEERFDHVVIATHSDQALTILGDDASDRERELLGRIPYQRNEAVLHTDASLLPRRRRAWASWNYHLLPDSERHPSTVTYHMNRLQSLESKLEFCVTLNLGDRIDPSKVLRRIEYAHPVFTPQGVAAQARVAEISGTGRTHFAGAYWGWGFHEDGVRSGLKVAEAFGESL